MCVGRKRRNVPRQAIRFLEECFVPNAERGEPMAEMLKQFNLWRGGKRTDVRAFSAMIRKAAGGADSVKKIRAVVAQSVKEIGKHQSTSGGWWYTPGNLDKDEGSTTVFAVQALASARTTQTAELVLQEMGRPGEPGRGVAAAQKVLAEAVPIG